MQPDVAWPSSLGTLSSRTTRHHALQTLLEIKRGGTLETDALDLGVGYASSHDTLVEKTPCWPASMSGCGRCAVGCILDLELAWTCLRVEIANSKFGLADPLTEIETTSNS